MDCHAKEELVVYQFLIGMDNHELKVQVAAHGHRHIEDILHIASSSEAGHEEEKHTPRACKPATQAQFVTKESADSIDIECMVQEVLAQLCYKSQLGHGGRHPLPTPGPKRV